MNQMVIEDLAPAAWRAKPPGQSRTIAAIFTHVHNARTKWEKTNCKYALLKPPPNE
jgi:hypothetical protein